MKLKPNIKTIKNFSVLRPGGNDTMLIEGLVKDPAKKKFINDQIMSLYPNVEQVGFYDFNPATNTATLEMAGGEFCGNATRSLAYLLLKGRKGEIAIQVSGTTKKLKAGVKQSNTAYTQIPIRENLSIKKLRDRLFRIDLEGITQLICLDSVSSVSPEKLKLAAVEILRKENLIYSVTAAGVMFIEDEKNFISLRPVVWVRDIETIFYETACASGTAAVGIWKATQQRKTKINIKVLQPSGKIIKAVINKKPLEVSIDGPIEILDKGGKNYECKY